MLCGCNKTWILLSFSGILGVLIASTLYKHNQVSETSLIIPDLPPASRRMTPTSTDPPQSSTVAAGKNTKFSCGDYLIFSNGFADGRGLGNQMFNLAAGVMVAQLTGRCVAINNSVVSTTYLEDLFDYTYERFNDTCATHQVADKLNLAYNPEVELMESSKTTDFASKALTLGGFFQSWKYTLNEHLLRSRYFKIKSELRRYVTNFFDSALPAGWRPNTFTRVGIHVRRGDVLTHSKIQFGYTTPVASYFRRAMLHMMGMYRRVQFIIASNDYAWCRSNLSPNLFRDVNMTSYTINITYSSASHNGSVDMALLASCHHSIMSTGTYGWWTAWLSRGTTIYYKEWPKQGSTLDRIFRKEDFFPPNWIGMSD